MRNSSVRIVCVKTITLSLFRIVGLGECNHRRVERGLCTYSACMYSIENTGYLMRICMQTLRFYDLLIPAKAVFLLHFPWRGCLSPVIAVFVG